MIGIADVAAHDLVKLLVIVYVKPATHVKVYASQYFISILKKAG